MDKEMKFIVDSNGNDIHKHKKNIYEEYKKKIYDRYQTISLNSNNFVGKTIITGLAFFVIGIFYQFGYAFLYGFYFGKSLPDEYRIWDFTINEIAFNVSYVIIVALLIMLIFACVGFITYNAVNHKLIRFRIPYYIMLLVVYEVMYAIISCICVEKEGLSINELSLNVVALIIFFLALGSFKKCIAFIVQGAAIGGILCIFEMIIVICVPIVLADKVKGPNYWIILLFSIMVQLAFNFILFVISCVSAWLKKCFLWLTNRKFMKEIRSTVKRKESKTNKNKRNSKPKKIRSQM